jgi:peptidoglycan/xylan/chitin deacetylase (PgdA/CDA1 family)
MIGIFTNDDVGASRTPQAVEAFETVADWLSGLGLRGTFFWVPKAGGQPGDQDELWLPALRRAEAAGHDFQLHGLTHGNCLEFGLTQESTRPSNPKPFEEYERHREHWEREHSIESLTAKLETGIAIYERAFGRHPVVFRSPCFGMCPNAYQALHDVGLRHSSSRGLNPTATAYTITGNPALRRWAPDYPCHPWVEPPGVIEYGCFEDLTFGGVPAEEFDDRLDLYQSELSSFFAEATEESVLVLGTHFSAMVSTWAQTRPLFERLLDWLPSQGVTKWQTFAEYVR